MPHRWSNPKRSWSSDRGGYLVFIVIALPVILALLGLAINSSDLYWAKHDAQLAVDAAAAAGAMRMVRYGDPYGDVSTGARGRAREILTENLRQAGIDSESAQIRVCFRANGECNSDDPAPSDPAYRRYIRAEVEFQRPTRILTLLLGTEASTVRASALIENQLLDVVVVIDASSSIRNGTFGAGESIKEALRSSISDFIDRLNRHDLLTVVYFAKNCPDTDKRKCKEGREMIESRVGSSDPDREAYYADDTDFSAARSWETYVEAYENDSWIGLMGLRRAIDDSSDKAAILRDIDSELNSGLSGSNVPSGIRRARQILSTPADPAIARLPLMVVFTDGRVHDFSPLTQWHHKSHWNTDQSRALDTVDRPCTYAPIKPTNRDGFQEVPATRWVGKARAIEWFRALDVIRETDEARAEGITVYTVTVDSPDQTYNLSPFQCTTADATKRLNNDPNQPRLCDFDAPPGDDGIPSNGRRGMKWALLQRAANDQGRMTATSPVPQFPLVNPRPGYPYLWDLPCVPSGEEIRNQPLGKLLIPTSAATMIDGFRSVLISRSRFIK